MTLYYQWSSIHAGITTLPKLKALFRTRDNIPGLDVATELMHLSRLEIQLPEPYLWYTPDPDFDKYGFLPFIAVCIFFR
jgi:hypothetical protein